jgi:cyclophilin family peptidyl-prolyl cis-trans isomerase
MRKLFVLAGVATIALLALSSSAAAQSTSCNGTLTGQTISGDLVVPDGGACTLVNSSVGDDVWVGSGAFFQATGSQIADHVESNRSQTLFIDTGSTVGGDVEANRTAQVFVYNSTIDGPVEAWRSTDKVQICGNTIDGNLHVHRSGTDILVGDPLAAGCAGNTVENGHWTRVQDNFTDVELVVRGNAIQGGDLTVNDNEGPSDKFVQSNTGGDDLDCFGNEQPFTASDNTGWNDQRNQCAVPPTECNGALTGQTIPGDLVVPDNGSCTLVNSSVGDDVKVGENAYFQATGSRIGDDVKGKRAQTVFIDSGTTVGGDVETWKTAQVFAFNATLNGNLNVHDSSDQVQACGNTIDGWVGIRGSGRDILFGDPKAVDCAANTVLNGHSVKIEDNFTDVELVVRGNSIQGGDLRVNDNQGPSDKFVEDNTGGDQLECFGNEQPFAASGNTGWKDQRGQCAVPPTECNGTLTGQTIPDDLIVPDNGSCVLVNSSVGDDVKVGENAFFQATGSQIGDDVSAFNSQTVFIDTGTTVGDDLRAFGTPQVFVFGASVGDRLLVTGSDDKVQICGSTLNGRSTVANSGRDILIGDPQAVDCAGNTIANGHSLTVADNFTDVEFVVRGNTFQGGDLRVIGNEGPVEKFVQDNTGGDELECFGNDDPFTATGNTFASEDGQCSEI